MLNFLKSKTDYILMHKNVPVLKADYSMIHHCFTKVHEIIDSKHLPIGVCPDGEFSLQALNHWFRWRGIPGYRVGLLQLENRLNIASPMDLIDQEHALSVSDTYWLKAGNERINWSQVNFYQHSFDQSGFAKAMFASLTPNVSSSALHTPNNCTCGYHRKAWFRRNGTLYLLKGGSPFYQQEPVNEWLASRIAKELNLFAIPYTTETYENNLVSVCPNMCNGRYDLVTSEYVLSDSHAPKKQFQYEHYIKTLQKHGIRNAKKVLSDQMLLDYLLMNTDRHTQNMGILVDANTNAWVSAAPVFDTGTGLGCLVDDMHILQEKNENKCQLFNAKHFSHEILLEMIDFKQYDFSTLQNIPQEFGNELQKYKPITNISDERIESVYRLLYQQIIDLKRAAK